LIIETLIAAVLAPSLSWSADSCPLRQEIGQMIVGSVSSADIGSQQFADYHKWAVKNDLGGIIVWGKDLHSFNTTNDLIRFTNALQDGMKTPMFIGTDQEGGMAQRLGPSLGFTLFPRAKRVGYANNPKLTRELGKAIGGELSAVGFNLDFAPVLDLDNPKNNVISGSGRALSSNPQVTAKLGGELIRGLEDADVVSMAKHFPGHGAADTDSHQAPAVMHKSWDDIVKSDLLPFMEAVKSGVSAILVGHLSLRDCPNQIASLSPAFIDGILRKQLGFNGLVVTDDLSMGGVTKTTASIEDASVKAILAGNDLLLMMHGEGIEQRVVNHLCQLTSENDDLAKQLKTRIDQSYARIINAKKQHGILNFKPLPLLSKPVSTDEHIELAQKIIDLAQPWMIKEGSETKAPAFVPPKPQPDMNPSMPKAALNQMRPIIP
jgi:beta-N-acetylhexosaminidase